MTEQASLFGDLPACPRTREGTHLEPTGADVKGPLLEVCDACRMDASWNPGLLCPTPEVHTWKEDTVDLATKESIADQVDMAIALQGEEVDGDAARGACMALLDREEWQEYPASNKAGEQSTYIQKLVVEVLTAIGSAPVEPKIERVPELGGWDASGEGPAPLGPKSGRIIG